MATLQWTQDIGTSDGVSERAFRVNREGAVIPGILWGPSELTGPQPVVLMGHGASGHKRNERMELLGQLLAREYGFYAAAIDGPVHGDRGPVTNPMQPEFLALWQRSNPVPGMIEDWQATLTGLIELDEIDGARVGYWGVSMGTVFGLPYVASDARIRVAVLGKAGMTGAAVALYGVDQYFKTYAAKVRMPVLFSIQWDDESFDREGQLELFDLLGSQDKRLHAYPGRHIDNGPEAFEVQAAFLKRHLSREQAFDAT